jgi:hypothetical protein
MSLPLAVGTGVGTTVKARLAILLDSNQIEPKIAEKWASRGLFL